MLLFEDKIMSNEKKFLKKIEHGLDITFNNNKYTTPITFEFTDGRDNIQDNIFNRHKKIFATIKLVDNSTKMITTAGKVFEHPQQIPSVQDYVTHSPFTDSIQKQRKVFINCKLESKIRVSNFKYEDKITMHTLIKNNTFLKFNKLNTRKKNCIRWFKYINPILTLQRITRENMTDALLQVYLSEEDMKRLSKEAKTEKDLLKSIYPHLTSIIKRSLMEIEKVTSQQAHMKSGVTLTSPKL